MATKDTKPKQLQPPAIWPVREAKSKLSEILRRARNEGPQYIGTHEPCVVVTKEVWDNLNEPGQPLTSWLIEHSPGIEMDIPGRGGSARRTAPFEDAGN